MSPAGELDSYPGDITLEVVPSSGVPIDLSHLMDRTTITYQAPRAGAPGDHGNFTVTIEDEGGVFMDALSDEAEARVYSKENPALAYPRLLHGYLKTRTLGTEGRDTLVTQISVTGDAILIEEPPFQLTATFRAGAIPWLPNHPYEVGDVVRPAEGNTTGHGHRFTCTIPGTSLDDPQGPVWDTASGAFTTDGSAQWQESGASFMTDREVLLELLPIFFGDAVSLTGISTLIAAMPYVEFAAGKPLSECLSEIASYAVSGTYDPWQPDTSYSPGDYVVPIPATGYVFQALTSGISGPFQPPWDNTTGEITLETGGTGTIEWVCMGRTSVVPVWGMQTPSDNVAHDATWTPGFQWIDLNDPAQVPTLTVEYSDQEAPDATHIHLEDLTITRETAETYNVVYVFGSNASMGEAPDDVRIASERRRRSIAIQDPDCQTNEDCDARANVYLALLGPRETGTGTANRLPDVATMLSARALHKVRVTNALYGLSEEEYPLTEIGIGFGSTLAKYDLKFGSGFMGSDDDVLAGRAGGRRFAGDTTPPELVRWVEDVGDPNYWLLDHEYRPRRRMVEIQAQWLSGNESDLQGGHFVVKAKVSGEFFSRALGLVLYPTQNITVSNLPPSLPGEPQTVQLFVLAVDSRGNHLRDRTGAPLYSASPVLTLAEPTQPEPPAGITLKSEELTWNDLIRTVFEIDPSPSPALAYYEASLVVNGQEPRVETVGDLSNYAVYVPPRALCSLSVVAVDFGGYRSDPAVHVWTAQHLPTTQTPPNGGFEIADPTDPTMAWLWDRGVVGGGTAVLTTDFDTGYRAMELAVPSLAVGSARIMSSRFLLGRVRTPIMVLKARVEANAVVALAWKVELYDVTGALIGTPATGTWDVGTEYALRTAPVALPAPGQPGVAYGRIVFDEDTPGAVVRIDNVSFGPQLVNDDFEDEVVTTGKLAPAAVTNDKLGVITDPTRFAPSTDPGTPWQLLDVNGDSALDVYASGDVSDGTAVATFLAQRGMRMEAANDGDFAAASGEQGKVQLSTGEQSMVFRSFAGSPPAVLADFQGTVAADAVNADAVSAAVFAQTIANKNGSFTADATAGTYRCNVSPLAPMTANLPAASSCTGRIYTFKRTAGGAQALTIDPNGAETIDGAATYSMPTQWQSVTIQSIGGTEWIIIGKV